MKALEDDNTKLRDLVGKPGTVSKPAALRGIRVIPSGTQQSILNSITVVQCAPLSSTEESNVSRSSDISFVERESETYSRELQRLEMLSARHTINLVQKVSAKEVSVQEDKRTKKLSYFIIADTLILFAILAQFISMIYLKDTKVPAATTSRPVAQIQVPENDRSAKLISGVDELIAKIADDNTSKTSNKSVVSPALSAKSKSTVFVKRNLYQKVEMEVGGSSTSEPITFSSFLVKFENGLANLKWADCEQRAVSYMLEKSEDGKKFVIYKILDIKPGKDPSVYCSVDREPSPFYRLVKVVHNGPLFISKVMEKEHPTEKAVFTVPEPAGDPVAFMDGNPS